MAAFFSMAAAFLEFTLLGGMVLAAQLKALRAVSWRNLIQLP